MTAEDEETNGWTGHLHPVPTGNCDQPFHAEADAADSDPDPLVDWLRTLDPVDRLRWPTPGRHHNRNMGQLLDTLNAAGVQIDRADLLTLSDLADWTPYRVDVIASLIRRAAGATDWYS